jgi:hypothetical protein
MSGDHRLLKLIQAGETSHLEFKSSLRWDLEQRKVNTVLTQAVVKSIAGFINSGGGTLLIGVADDGQIPGIEQDVESLTRKSLDGFEQTLRTAIGKFLGVDVSAEVAIQFVSLDGKKIAEVVCKRYEEPVFLKEGDQYTFYARVGNTTRPLNVLEQHKYIKRHFPAPPSIERATIREVVKEVLSAQEVRKPLKLSTPSWGERLLNFFRKSAAGVLPPGPLEQIESLVEVAVDESEHQRTSESTQLPPWLSVRTRNVLDAYLNALQRSQDWKRLHIISPWLSNLDTNFSLTSEALADRLKKYGTTVYVVTRPPIVDWHKKAIDALAATERANIALVPDLHAKLYIASTAASSFALLSSANFTQQSADNFEIGLLAHSYMEGKKVASALDREAVGIYRTTGRELIHRARF